MAGCTINRSIIFARNAAARGRTQPFDFVAPPLFAKRKKRSKKWRSHSALSALHYSLTLRASPHAKQVFKSHSLEGRCFRNHIRNPLDGARAGEGVASFHTQQPPVRSWGCKEAVWIMCRESERERAKASTPQCLCNILRVQWVIQLLAQLCCCCCAAWQMGKSAGVSATCCERRCVRVTRGVSERVRECVRPFPMRFLRWNSHICATADLHNELRNYAATRKSVPWEDDLILGFNGSVLLDF